MPDENALRRAQLRKAAQLRAQFNLDTALARIDYGIDVIEPAKKEVADRFARGTVEPISGQLEID